MLAIILFDGLNYAATLFLIAVGLTFIYGVLAHPKKQTLTKT